VSVLSGERPASDRSILRFIAFGVAVIIGVGALTTRLAFLQIAHSGQYAELSDRNRSVLQAIPSSRGLIFDRAGRPLVTNVPSFAVKIRPADLPLSQRDAVLTRLGGLLHMDPSDINTEIDSNPGSRFDLVRIAQDVPEATARLIAEAHLELPGVEVVVEARREYADGPMFSQIVGYTGPVTAEQLPKLKDVGYLPDDMIGRTGVEAVYEEQLRGAYGAETVERDASGRKIQVLETVRPARAGDSLMLTIDVREQALAQRALEWGMAEAGLKRGVVIVMNPQTGEILAMVSLPSYDNNAFAGGISDELYQSYLADANLPLRNHAISDIYPPGSTFKLATGLAALQEGVTTPTQRWQTYGCYQIPGAPAGDCLYDWNHRGFGKLNIVEAFAISSDTFFYQMAVHLGVDKLARWAHALGFGTPTGIDLPNEASGIIASTEWAHSQGRAGVYTGELAQAGIGQNVIAVTPLQLLNAYAALANGGHLMKPMIVRGEADASGNLVREYAPQVLGEVGATDENLRLLRIGARQVITTGHAYNIRDLRLPGSLAGKTGTAEFGLPDANGVLPFHSWFVAFLPSAPGATDSPIAVITFTYHATVIGNVSTEVVKYFLQQYFHTSQDLRLDPVTLRQLVGGN